MPPYEDTFDDYLEMVVQYAYLTLFSVVLPLAPLMVLLNNALELRTDAAKILMCRRQVARRAAGIGMWEPLLVAISYASVLTNVSVLFFTSDSLDGFFSSDASKLWCAIALEHLLLFAKTVVSVSIPDAPDLVVRENKRRRLGRLQSSSSLTSAVPSSSSSSSSSASSLAASSMGSGGARGRGSSIKIDVRRWIDPGIVPLDCDDAEEPVGANGKRKNE
jgi:hypothetical protein